VPYCSGVATHAEWVNSKAAFDHQRAEAGEGRFKFGALFDRRAGLRVFELASFFEDAFKPLVGELAGKNGAKYPTWQALLNDARRN